MEDNKLQDEQTQENETVEVVEENVEVETTQDVVEEKDSAPETETTQKESKPKAVKPRKKTKAEKEKERLASYEGLSDDELYAKIQTEKLVRRKKNNKLTTLIALSCAFVMAVAVLVMAAVPVSLKPKCLSGDFMRVTVYPGTTTTAVCFEEESKGYDEFMKVYNNSFKQTYIAALFSGNLFAYDIEEQWANVPSLLSMTSNSTYVMHLEYDEDKTLTYRNGKKYESRYATALWESAELTFKDVYIVINEEEGMRDTTVYVAVNNYPVFNEQKEETGHKTTGNLVKITLKANTSTIYEAYDELAKIAE